MDGVSYRTFTARFTSGSPSSSKVTQYTPGAVCGVPHVLVLPFAAGAFLQYLQVLAIAAVYHQHGTATALQGVAHRGLLGEGVGGDGEEAFAGGVGEHAAFGAITRGL